MGDQIQDLHLRLAPDSGHSAAPMLNITVVLCLICWAHICLIPSKWHAAGSCRPFMHVAVPLGHASQAAAIPAASGCISSGSAASCLFCACLQNLPLPSPHSSPMGAPSSSLDALWQDLEAHTAGKPLVKAAAMHHLQQVSDLLQAGSQLHWPSVRTCIAMLCRTDDAALIGRLVTGWSVQEFHWMLHTCNLFTGEALAVAVLHAYCNGCIECACGVQMPAYLPTAAQLGQGLPQRHVLCIPSILLCLQQLSPAPGAERGSQSCAEAVGSRRLVCVSQHPAPCLQPTRTLCASSDASTAWWPNRDPVALQRRPGCAAAGWGMPKVTLLSQSLYLHPEHPYYSLVVPNPALLCYICFDSSTWCQEGYCLCTIHCNCKGWIADKACHGWARDPHVRQLPSSLAILQATQP